MAYDQSAKMAGDAPYRGLGAPTAPASDMREPQQILMGIRSAMETVEAIEMSVRLARQALWGPWPEQSTDAAGPKIVIPDGFIPQAQHLIAQLIVRIRALDESARHLRNL